MKNLILSLLTVTVYFTAFGQTDYYTGKTQVAGKNVTYSCGDNKFSFMLTNVNRTYVSQTQRMSDGTPVDESLPAMDYRGIKDPDRALLHRAFRETFSPEQITAMKEQEGRGTIFFYADPGGLIKDAVLIINKTPATVSISPDQWFTLEQKLKQYLTAKQEICKYYQFAVFFTGFKFDEL